MKDDTAPSSRVALSVREAHQMIGVGKTSLYAMIARNELLTIRIGRRRLVLRSSIDALISRATLAEVE